MRPMQISDDAHGALSDASAVDGRPMIAMLDEAVLGYLRHADLVTRRRLAVRAAEDGRSIAEHIAAALAAYVEG